MKGLVWSAAAMGVLLNEGIGDTIRVSLTPRPGGDRREEVYAACELLQSLGLRSFSPSVTACPGCGRTTSTTFQELAERIQDYIREQMPEWKTRYEGVETMTLAVMGCVVNGPGESKAANIGISLPGTGEAPNCPDLHRRRARDDAARHLRRARRRVPAARRRLRRAPTTRGKPDRVRSGDRVIVRDARCSTRCIASGASPTSGRCSAKPCTPSSTAATASSCCRPAAASRSASRRRRSCRTARRRPPTPPRLRARRLAADLADEGSGRRPARRRRRGRLPEQHADAGASATRCWRACATIAAGCSTCRPSGWSARAARASAACCSSAACASSRSTRRTASASGATISGPSTASSGGCATSSPASRSTRSPRRPPSGCAATSSRELRLHDPLVLVGSFDRPNLTYRVLRRGNLHAQLLADPRPPRGRSGHRLLPVAARSRGARRVAGRRGASARCRITPACPTTCAPGTRRSSSTSASTSSSRRWRSGWASIDRTSGSSCTPGAPRSPEHYQQESGRAGRDGLPAECVLIYSGSDFVRWRQMLEANGELTESARDAAARHGALRGRHALPAPRRWSSTSASRYERADVRRVRLVPEGARSRWPDSTTVARKILSCVARVRQTWGVGHVDRRAARARPARRSSPPGTTSCRRSAC